MRFRPIALLAAAFALAAPAAFADCSTTASGATVCVESSYGTADASQLDLVRSMTGQLFTQRCAVGPSETVCAWHVDTSVLRDNFFLAVFMTVACAWFSLRVVWVMLRLFGIVKR